MGQERRKEKRYPIDYPLEEIDRPSVEPVRAVDLNSKGAGFYSKYPFKHGKKIKINIFLKTRRYSLTGEVVRQAKIKEDLYFVGLIFLDTTEDFKRTFFQEIDQVNQRKLESKIYSNKEISFKEASKEYLGA